MTENEAKDLLEKLKPLEKRAEMKKGGTIDKFFIVPRLTTAQRDGVASTTAGAIIYNTTDNRHQGYNGTTWNNFYV